MKEILKKSLVLSFYELKVKNHNTYLGFLWYFLQPLLMFAVLFYVKHKIVDDEIVDFIPYLFIGVIMVHFFISSTSLIMKAVTSNYDLLNSRKIDVEVFVWSKFLVSIWNHLFESVLVIIILSFFGYYHSVFYLFVIPFYALFILGVGKFLCVVSTKFFDATYLWTYFCQILWFILPIYYVTNKSDFILKFNPLNYFLDFARGLTYDLNNVSINMILMCLVFSWVSYLIGTWIFSSQKYLITERLK